MPTITDSSSHKIPPVLRAPPKIISFGHLMETSLAGEEVVVVAVACCVVVAALKARTAANPKRGES